MSTRSAFQSEDLTLFSVSEVLATKSPITITIDGKPVGEIPPPALGPKAVRHYAPSVQETVEDAFKVFDQIKYDPMFQ